MTHHIAHTTARSRHSAPDPAAPMAPDEFECLQKRTLDGLARCVALLAGELGRDWLHCGKAACARSRRCRGVACEPYADE